MNNGRTRPGAPVVFPVAFIGFMAAGKTTLSRELASKLGGRFFDLDEMLVQSVGMEIFDIFSCHGEAFFRDRERELLQELVAGPAVEASTLPILATGGGIVGQETNRQLLRDNTFSIFIDPPFEILWERLKLASPKRPLAVFRTRQELELLWHERRPWYLQTARLTVAGEHHVAEQLEFILSHLRTSPD